MQQLLHDKLCKSGGVAAAERRGQKPLQVPAVLRALTVRRSTEPHQYQQGLQLSRLQSVHQKMQQQPQQPPLMGAYEAQGAAESKEKKSERAGADRSAGAITMPCPAPHQYYTALLRPHTCTRRIAASPIAVA
jgi:hypothetical protein